MDRYRVRAPFVMLKFRDPTTGANQVQGFYAGALVPDTVDPASLEHHLGTKQVEKVDTEVEAEQLAPQARDGAETPESTVVTSTTPAAPNAPARTVVERPADDADAAAWVEYAVNHPDPSRRLTREEAEGMDAGQLRARLTDPAAQRPAANASQAAWIAYAVNHPDPARRMSQEDASKLSRDALRDRLS